MNAINTSIASVRLSVELAVLYFKAGYKDQAWADLDEARAMAYHEKDLDLLGEIDEIMSRLEAGD